MNLLIHHIVKDLTHTRWVLWTFLAALVVNNARSVMHISTFGTSESEAVFFEMLFRAFELGFICRIVHAEPLTGDTALWMTRPISRWFLLTEKLLFVATFCVAPILFADLLNGSDGAPFYVRSFFETCIAFFLVASAALTPSFVHALAAAGVMVWLMNLARIYLEGSLGFGIPGEVGLLITMFWWCACNAAIATVCFGSRRRVIPWAFFLSLPFIQLS